MIFIPKDEYLVPSWTQGLLVTEHVVLSSDDNGDLIHGMGSTSFFDAGEVALLTTAVINPDFHSEELLKEIARFAYPFVDQDIQIRRKANGNYMVTNRNAREGKTVSIPREGISLGATRL